MNINQILAAAPVPSRYGAPMGARSVFDDESPRLYVQPVRMVDYDYDPAGVYWGGWSRQHGRIYCGFNDSSRVFVRAHTRAHAIELIRAEYPDATFYRG